MVRNAAWRRADGEYCVRYTWECCAAMNLGNQRENCHVVIAIVGIRGR